MKKTFCSLLLLCLLLSVKTIVSQTTLAPGDMAFIGFNTSNDAVSLVTFVNLCPGTVFYYTDNPYRNSNGFCTSGEEYCIRFTVNTTIAAGTKITYSDDDYPAVGTINLSPTGGSITAAYAYTAQAGTNNGFNNAGDNVFVFQGTYSAPTFVCGLKNSGNWNATGSVSCGNRDHSELPSTLTNGVNALVACVNTGMRYNCTTVSGTATMLRTAINNISNWTCSGSAVTLPPSCNFTVTGVSPLPAVSAAATSTAICSGSAVTLTASGASSFTWSSNAGSAATSTVSVSPGITTTYTVTGNESGCTDTETITINVTATPTVSITGITSVCSGNSTVLTGATAGNYTWMPGGITTNTINVSPAGNTTYTLTGSNGSCSATSQITVTVTATPTITISGTDSICSGTGTVLTGATAANYTWSPGGITTSTLSVNPSVSTTYTLSGANGNCTSSSTFSLTIVDTPTLSITGNTGICSGDSTTLTAGTAATYNWAPGGQTGNSIILHPSATSTYTLTGANGSCTSSITATVNVTSTPTVSITSSPAGLCAGQSTTLSAGGATSYTWTPGGTTGGSITVSPADTTTYTVSGDNGGCSATQTITINIIPLPVIQATAVPASICEGQSTVLSGNGASSYVWSGNAGSVTTNTVAVSPTTSATYTLTGTQNGCTDSTTVTIQVNTLPPVTASSSQNGVCLGQSAVLTGNGAATYSWLPGGATANTITVSPTSATTYTLTGFNGNCSNTQTITINAFSNPVLTISGTTQLCAGQSTSISAGGAASYSWTPGGISTDTISISPSATTTYTVTGQNSDGCIASQTVSVVVNALPSLSTVNNQSACAGSPVTGINFTANPVTSLVAWSNNNTAIGLGGTGTGNINGYITPSVVNEETATITVIPVDITSTCAGNPVTFSITVYPAPVVSGGSADSSLCGQNNGGVSGVTVSGGTPAYQFQWFNESTLLTGETSSSLNNAGPGHYSLAVADAHGCVAPGGPFSFTIGGSPAVTATISPDTIHGQAPLNASFVNTTTGTATYTWNFNNGSTSSLQSPSPVTYTSQGTYSVSMIAANGSCIDTAFAIVIVDVPITFVIPNIYSPNGDGVNDAFGISGDGIVTLNCDIFNRWGQKVKTLSAPGQKWDGRLDNGNTAPDGTYYYLLTAGSYDGKEYRREGFVTLVR